MHLNLYAGSLFSHAEDSSEHSILRSSRFAVGQGSSFRPRGKNRSALGRVWILVEGLPARSRATTEIRLGGHNLLRQDLVELVGFEPTTSSMPWRRKSSRQLVFKWLATGILA
jgi:hypothetical protein